MKRKLCLLMVFALLVVLLFPAAVLAEEAEGTADDLRNKYQSGALPETEEALASLVEIALPGEVSPQGFGPTVDLSPSFPDVGFQGDYGSCVGWAIAYVKGYQEEIERGWGRKMFSPGFLFNQRQDTSINGMHVAEGLGLLQSLGVCTQQTFGADEYGTSAPTPEQLSEAAYFRGISPGYITINHSEPQTAINTAKWLLNNNIPLIFSVNLSDDVYELDAENPVWNATGSYNGQAHAVAVTGYDDSLGAFKFINSWGAEWGLGGYGYLSYTCLDDSRDYAPVRYAYAVLDGGFKQVDGVTQYAVDAPAALNGAFTPEAFTYAAGAWQQDYDGTYYFDEDGAMHTGWLQADARYYFKADGKLAQNEVLVIDDEMQLFGQAGMWRGNAAPGWNHYGEESYYIEDGHTVAGWKCIDDVWYYFDAFGVMQKALSASDAGADALGPGGEAYAKTSDDELAAAMFGRAASSAFSSGSQGLQSIQIHRSDHAGQTPQSGWSQANGSLGYYNSSGALQAGRPMAEARWLHLHGNGISAAEWAADALPQPAC